ncbi:MAG: DUF5916 domain-containing protein [Bacteroidetes bacterium]|nr:DUF5916 domain-containing protein [Bacteroidota bacterium]
MTIKNLFKNIFCLIFVAQLLIADNTIKISPTTKPPVLDGILDDLAWKNAISFSAFKTFIPDFGKTMPESTVVYTTYDKDNLYFAFKCFDPNPDLIKAEITARDNLRPHDWVCINLDSFNDQQSLYGFYVNPLGIQADSKFAAQNEDHGVDYIWYSAGKIVEDGYNIEIQIPFKSIRYKNVDPVIMAVAFERRVSKRSEQATYPALDPKKGYNFLIQLLPFELNNIEHYSLFELIPSSTFNQKYKYQNNKLEEYYSKNELSLTAKYGITSDLVLDATINPDFSQVEADAGQVDLNLRSALYFAEKRPFFLEGSEIFNLAGSNHSTQIVYTRQINNPKVGLKLSGKISDKSTLATIFAVDEVMNSNLTPSGQDAIFPIFRYKHSLSGDSYLGGIFTGKEMENYFNRVAGTDGIFRISESSYFAHQILFSNSKSSSDKEALDGHSFTINYNYSTRDLDLNLLGSKISNNFLADAGYISRTGIATFMAFMKPKFYTSSDFIRRIDIDIYTSHTQDLYSKLWETYNSISSKLFLMGALNFNLKYNYSTEIFKNTKFETSGFSISGGGQFNKELNVSSSYRTGKSIYYSNDPFQGNSSQFTSTINYQPLSQLESKTNITFVSFSKSSNDSLIYEYPIYRERLTFQLNQYFFIRAIVEYNKYKKTFLSDFLSSFTYIPFTTFYVGYGSLYQNLSLSSEIDRNVYNEVNRGIFVKASYLWRL